MPSGSNDLPGELPRSYEIRSIIIQRCSADGQEIIRFTWKRAAFSILSSRLFIRSIRGASRQCFSTRRQICQVISYL